MNDHIPSTSTLPKMCLLKPKFKPPTIVIQIRLTQNSPKKAPTRSAKRIINNKPPTTNSSLLHIQSAVKMNRLESEFEKDYNGRGEELGKNVDVTLVASKAADFFDGINVKVGQLKWMQRELVASNDSLPEVGGVLDLERTEAARKSASSQIARPSSESPSPMGAPRELVVANLVNVPTIDRQYDQNASKSVDQKKQMEDQKSSSSPNENTCDQYLVHEKMNWQPDRNDELARQVHYTISARKTNKSEIFESHDMLPKVSQSSRNEMLDELQLKRENHASGHQEETTTLISRPSSPSSFHDDYQDASLTSATANTLPANSTPKQQLIEYNGDLLDASLVKVDASQLIVMSALDCQAPSSSSSSSSSITSSTTDKPRQQVGGNQDDHLKSSDEIIKREKVNSIAFQFKDSLPINPLNIQQIENSEMAPKPTNSSLNSKSKKSLNSSETNATKLKDSVQNNVTKSNSTTTTTTTTTSSKKPNSAMARIAVPVARKSTTSSKNCNQQAQIKSTNNTNNQPESQLKSIRQNQKKKSVFELANKRSKSNLDSSSLSLGRITTTTTTTTTTSQQINPKKPSNVSNKCQMKTGVSLLKNDPKSRSSSSIGFVTQIPTLISQSHVPPSSSSSSSSSNSSTAAPSSSCSAVNSAANSFLPRAFSSQQRLASCSSNTSARVASSQSVKRDLPATLSASKSMSNLQQQLSMMNKANVDYDEEHSKQGEENCEFSRNANQLDELNSSSSSKTLDKATSRSCSLLPRAPPPPPIIISSSSSVELAKESSTLNNIPSAGVALWSSSVSVISSPKDCSKEEERGGGGGGGGAGEEESEEACKDRVTDSKQKGNKAIGREQLASSCSQCKLYQLKLNLLLKDRRQLNEQINELEEMENDSRLMSQKLAQKLFSLEQQFDSCKLELEKSYQNEDKLKFHIKRLSFELKEQLETIEQLQWKLAKFQSTLLNQQEHSNSNVGRYVADDCDIKDNNKRQTNRQSSEQQDNNNNNNNDEALLDLEPDSKSNFIKNSSIECSQTDDSTESARFGCQKFVKTTKVVNTSTTASGSSDEDSAIESIFDKANKLNVTNSTNNNKSLESNDVADISIEDEKEDQAGPNKLMKIRCDDSLYSKSSSASASSSSYANSDDGSRSESDNLQNSDPLSPESSSFEPNNVKNQLSRATQVSSPNFIMTSPSSSGDESDHHHHHHPHSQASKTQSSISDSANFDENLQKSQANSNSRAQVLRKRTSTSGVSIARNNFNNNLTNCQLINNESDKSSIVSSSANQRQTVSQTRFLQVLVTNSSSCCAESEKESNEMKRRESLKDEQQSSIDLALKGVDDLEKGRLEEAFHSLLEVNKDDNKKDEGSGDKNQQQQQIGIYKQEIANLRLRLLQAQALNDNLVAELKSNSLKFKTTTTTTTTKEQDYHSKQQLAARKCSIIYVNGQQPLNTELINLNTTSKLCNSNQYHQQQQLHNHSNTEFVEFLRFLLDKIHFHNGRTFELVNDCQKLALNALLAGYSHQINLAHHNEVVLAGNQACQREFPLQQHQTAHQHQTYPIRPPPRRRNNSSNSNSNQICPPSIEASNQLVDRPSNYLNNKTTTQQEPQPPPTVRCSALQVAKQTLFSIVPIYHVGGSDKGGSKGCKVAKEKSNNNCKQTSGKSNDSPSSTSIATTNKLNCKTKSLSSSNFKKCFLKINQTCDQHDNQNDHFDKSGLSNISVLQINNCPKQQKQDISSDNLQKNSILSDKVKYSLSEDIERYRVHFNGQLLDLLTRQNSCESIITEKLKLLTIPSSFYTANTIQSHEIKRPQSMYINSSNTAESRQMIQSANLHLNTQHPAIQNPVPITNISLNPNSYIVHNQQQQHPMRQNWIINQDSSSLC